MGIAMTYAIANVVVLGLFFLPPIDWLKNKKFSCINYSNLLNKYSSTMKNVCNELSLEVIERPQMPSKNNYIKWIESLKVSEYVRIKMN